MVAMGLFRYYIKGDSPPPSAELPWRQLVPLAAACVGFYLAAATRRLLDRDVLRRLLWPFPETSALSVILCLTLVIAVKVTVWLWLVPSSPGISVRHFIKTTSLLALVKPGIFFVAHVVYFGPIVWEAVWLWSKVAQNVRSLGLGAVLAAALAILMSITSESRHLIPFIPLLVAATAWAMDSEPLCRAQTWAFVVWALVLAKFWLPIDAGTFSHAASDFPEQLYFMNQGPWMSGVSYLVQGTVVILAGMVLKLWQVGKPSFNATGL